MRRYFCTYFDHRYLPRGMALYHSLKEHCPSFHLWILCLSPESYEILCRKRLDSVTLLPMEDIENGDDELLEAKNNRSLVEYYFTLTPTLPLYVLNHFTEVDIITYLDSDLYFFSDPEPLFDEIGDNSVGIIAHRFPERLKGYEKFGIYNVGWLSFRRDRSGLNCLHWYRERCNEWCYDRVEGERFADQKYLDKFQMLFENVHVVKHKGANLAPWNIDNYTITEQDNQIYVDEHPLIFHHFQGLKKLTFFLYDSGFAEYKTRFSKFVCDKIYTPYIEELEKYQNALNLSTNEQFASIRTGYGRYRRLQMVAPLIFNFLKKLKAISRVFCTKTYVLIP